MVNLSVDERMIRSRIERFPEFHRVRSCYPDSAFRSRSSASAESRNREPTRVGSRYSHRQPRCKSATSSAKGVRDMTKVLLLCGALLGVVWGAATNQDPLESCQPDKLTVYKVVLHTFWSRETFPKHYPDWRPPASWSKVFVSLLQNVCNTTLYTVNLSGWQDSRGSWLVAAPQTTPKRAPHNNSTFVMSRTPLAEEVADLQRGCR
ncbi:hypothetical protein HUJ04_006291 [Dendroctonus ponderosae]|nr:hypothetical protein HUJ04_006291 [Dendroctonus ponderosae]